MNDAAEQMTNDDVRVASEIVGVEDVFADLMVALKKGGVAVETISIALTDLAGKLAGSQADQGVGDRLAKVYEEARRRAGNTHTKGEHRE